MFLLNSSDPLPLYQQLYRQLRERILAGRLPANSRLPSVRELARELATSRNTVEAAYQELLAEGYLYSRERSGCFVSPLDTEPIPRRRASPPRPAAPVTNDVAPCRYDFHPARLDPGSFPLALWRKCYVESLRSCGDELTAYGDPQGDLQLRRQLQSYLERSRGVICAPEQIVITAGLQQSLEVVAALLRERHATLAVENPGYHLPRAVFAHHGYAVAPLPVTAQRLDVEVLKGSGAALVYVTPSHQLPLGYVMPIARRLQLLDWAEEGERIILEDDYDSELRYHGRPIPALQGLRPQGRVVYLGTVSKVLSPALRLSYLVLPPALLDGYRQHFAAYFSAVPLPEQRALAHFMAQGHWERHLRRMRTRYQKKHDLLLAAVARHFGRRAVVIGQGAGLHVVLELADPNPGEAVILRRAAAEGVRLFPFSAFYGSVPPARTLLILGFGGLNVEEIVTGIALLSGLCD